MPRAVAALAGPAAVAAVLRLWDLAGVGFGNLYYAATVKSMLRSPSTFLYASFDPGGFVTVDKPPLGLWTQAALAKIAGFSGLVLQLPQAIAGTISVVALGRIVARDFGLAAGAIAALVLALMPVAVAVDRNNTMDAQLVLLLIGAAYGVLRAAERSSPRWLALAGALVGLAFNVKMSQAFLPLPAFALAYVVGSRARAVPRIAHLVVFATVTLGVSLAWIAVVDLTPAELRPYVGSSRNNTALDLALGHNGAARLPQELLSWLRPPASPPQGLARPPGAPPPPPPAAVPGPGPNAEAGERGPLRLFNAQLAGQVSWFVPLAFVGAAAAFAREGRRWPLTAPQVALVLWLAWLVPAAALFSWSGIFHRYYLVMLGPPLAALCGAGAVALVAIARSHHLGGIFLASAALLTAYVQVAIVEQARPFAAWLVPVIVLGALVALGVAALARVLPSRIVLALAALALAAFLAAPLAWASTTLAAADAGLPYAGPELLGGPRSVPRAPIGILPPRGRMLEFLVAEHRGERWIVATATTGSAAPLMLQGDVAVMALGGFSGGDPILTVGALETKVRAGDVRFVLVEQRMRADLGAWLRARCVEVPAARVGAVLGGPQAGGPQMLVDCANVRNTP